MICVNRIHRIPIVHFDDGCTDVRKEQGRLLYVLSLKAVFINTIVKLVPQTATCDVAINLLLEKRISIVPVVDSNGRIRGVISKSDVMSELVRHPSNYLEVLDIPVMDVIASSTQPAYGTSTMTVYDCIASMVTTDRQAIVSVLYIW
ncbi:unnamed protein product [Nippostrongylus brasiliensis]|uniref:CBS domain-containing protein n=1 Tax=Nippostrongylus brasiliensis TaxID=27835 RepID=A0A0N4YRI9_NIPBR|nr:unnamed protein product [Nippostrongylus brasiliensis]